MVAELPALLGDCDGNGLIDADDVGCLVDCMAGPGAEPPFGCERADINSDGFVDLRDWSVLELIVAGE